VPKKYSEIDPAGLVLECGAKIGTEKGGKGKRKKKVISRTRRREGGKRSNNHHSWAGKGGELNAATTNNGGDRDAVATKPKAMIVIV